MDDVISRQALLDKFEPWLKVKDYNDGELNMLKAILYEIRFMPPATDKNVGTKLSTNLAEVGTDLATKRTVKGFPIDADLLMLKAEEEYGFRARDRLYEIIRTMPKYELPSVQPKRGRWERGFDGNHAVCSNCQAWWIPFGEGYKTDYHFCPNCGADMRGEQDDSV